MNPSLFLGPSFALRLLLGFLQHLLKGVAVNGGQVKLDEVIINIELSHFRISDVDISLVSSPNDLRGDHIPQINASLVTVDGLLLVRRDERLPKLTNGSFSAQLIGSNIMRCSVRVSIPFTLPFFVE